MAIFFLTYLLIYFRLHWVLIATGRLSLIVESGGYSLLRCVGFSLRWFLSLQNTGSRWASFSSWGLWALELWLSSCGTWAQMICSMWDLPGPGFEPVSPELAGGFFTIGPPGKPQQLSSLKAHQLLPQFSVLRLGGHSAKVDGRECGVHYQSDPRGLTSGKLGLLSSHIMIWLIWILQLGNLSQPKLPSCFSNKEENYFGIRPFRYWITLWSKWMIH